jgi:hypothetical protein
LDKGDSPVDLGLYSGRTIEGWANMECGSDLLLAAVHEFLLCGWTIRFGLLV